MSCVRSGAKTESTPSHRRALVTLGALLLLFTTPGPASGAFDGLPWSTPWEFAAVVVLTASMFSGETRRRITDVVTRPTAVGCGMVHWLILALAVAKTVAFVAVPSHGAFEACYRDVAADDSEPCAVSFENPWGTAGVTRFDRELDFGPDRAGGRRTTETNWNLGMVNEKRYDNHPVDETRVDYSRFPFQAHWRGVAEVGDSGRVTISYVGEGRATIGDVEIDLPASYASPNKVIVDVQPGGHPFETVFLFTSSVRGGETPPGPYATLRVDGLEPGSPFPAVTALVVAVDVVAVVALAAVLFAFGRSIRRTVPTLMGALTAWIATRLLIGFDVVPELVSGQVPITAVVMSVATFGLILLQPRRVIPFGYASVSLVALERVLIFTGGWERVLYRSRGDD